MADMLGYTVADMQGKHLFSFMDEADVAAAQHNLARRRQGIIEQHDFEFLRKDGSPLFVTLATAPIMDAQGHFDGAIAGLIDITERRKVEERLARLNACFLSFGPDPMANINQLTRLCGEFLGADCALYNRLYEEMLCSWGQWQTPADYNPVDKPEGHICYDLIRQSQDEVVIIRNLLETDYVQTDSNVKLYNLQTYIGKAIQLDDTAVGSLCVIYQRDFEPTPDDLQIMDLIGSAIVIEERRRQAETSLKETHEHLRATLDALPDLMFEVDRDGRIIDFHAPDPELLYVPPEKFLDKTIPEVLPSEIAGIIMDAIKQAAAGGRHTGTVYALDIPAGRHWFEASIAIKGDSESRNGRFIILSRDITERKQAETALRESRNLFVAVTEQSSEGVSVANKAGRYVLVNAAFCQMTGYTKEELLSMNMRDLVPDGIELDLFPKVISNQSGERIMQIQRKDGSRFFANINGTPIETGGEQLVLGIVRDITEQVQAEAALRESYEQLEKALAELKEAQTQMVQQERLAAVGQLAAGIAHDFNNLMATIILYPELLLGTAKLTPKDQAKVMTIRQQGQRAAALTQQILDFSRKSIIQRSSLDLHPFLQELQALLSRTLPENMQLTLTGRPQEYLVNADPHDCSK